MPRQPRRLRAQPADDPQHEEHPERAQVRTLLAETQALSARLAALNEVATAMQSSLELEGVLESLAREARWIIDFQYCSVAELSGDSYLERVLKSSDHTMPTTRRMPIASGPIGRAIEAGHALLLRTLEESAGAPLGMQSGLIVPLRGRGEVIGTLNMFAERPNQYSYDDLRIVSALAVQVGLTIQNTRLFREIADARDEMQTILESIGDAVIVLDADGLVMLINPAARRLLHLPAGLGSGRHLFWLAAQAKVDRRRLIPREALQAAAQELRPGAGGRMELSDGRHVEWAAAPLQGSLGEPGFVLTLRDISDRVALAQLQDDLIDMLVHDLRTPLAGLIMSLGLLNYQDASNSPEEAAELLQQANESARRLLHQVNTLLDMRKLEAGRLQLQQRSTRASTLADTVLQRLGVLAQLSKVELSNELGTELPLLSVDVALIERVLENLVANAIRFTPPGGSIVLGAQVYGDEAVEVTVCDQGVGVPLHMRQQIFEKYVQSQVSHTRYGTGLGLAFCKLVVEAHGGQIGLRDTPGGGSTFWFTLPVAES